MNALETLSAHHITLTDLLTSIISGDPEFITYRYALFSEKNRLHLQNLFSLILKDEKGSHIVQEWMKPYAIQQVCDTIHEEMDAAKPHLQMNIKDITPDFISNWDVNKILEPIGRNITPTFCMILDAATETKASKAKQKSPKSRNRITVSPPIQFELFSTLINQSRKGETNYMCTMSLPALICLLHDPDGSRPCCVVEWSFAPTHEHPPSIMPLNVIFQYRHDPQ